MPDEVDLVVFATESVTIGAFRCPSDHPSFRDSGPIKDDCFVFPRTTVEIRHSDARPFVADPTVVTLYNRSQVYERRPVAGQADRCDWFAIAPDILRDALSLRDPTAAADERPMRFTHAVAHPSTYYAQRRLFLSVCRARAGHACDPLVVEERVVALLDRVLAGAYRSSPPRPRLAENRRARDLAEAAKRFIAPRVAARLTLAAVAQAIGCSAFHLCRSFGRATGQTLHAYREQMRVRYALERLEQGERDLSRVALDLGYSSHSHFTAAFRHSFGQTPSRARRTLVDL